MKILDVVDAFIRRQAGFSGTTQSTGNELIYKGFKLAQHRADGLYITISPIGEQDNYVRIRLNQLLSNVKSRHFVFFKGHHNFYGGVAMMPREWIKVEQSA